MKEIIILISNANDIKNKSNQFMFNMTDYLYKSGIKVTVFSKSFPKNFPAYITRKHLSSLFFNKEAKNIAKLAENADVVMAVDFPMNIIASITKNILIKKRINKLPLIVWYALNFQNHLYFEESKYNKTKLTDKRLIKLDYEHTCNIDMIICGSIKIKERLLYLHNDIKNINVIQPYFSPYIFIHNGKKEKDKSIVIFYNKEDSIFKCTAAYAEYLKESDDIYKLKIIGYDKELKENINKLSIEQYVEFADENDNYSIANAIETSNAMIIHNIKDSFYTQLIAAWHYKTLPIIDSKSSSAEIVSDNKNALIYDSKNPISIISKIKKISEHQKSYNIFMPSIDEMQNENKILELISNYQLN
ncbi:glycosyltransferase [uncultured Brachyspira sp.]|uniref:glycosyltransferase n=1 Tax=uncultured Brachyspira sp. TaxID=221953 RepID=UPI0025F18F50|nr:glycosyltransferase [uncultured Brachyspira sp.]